MNTMASALTRVSDESLDVLLSHVLAQCNLWVVNAKWAYMVVREYKRRHSHRPKI